MLIGQSLSEVSESHTIAPLLFRTILNYKAVVIGQNCNGFSLKFAAILRTTIRTKYVKRHQDQKRPEHSLKGRGR